MNDLKIRYALETDILKLLPLFAELGYPTTEEVLRERFKKFLQNEGYGVVVCELRSEIAGWIAWSQSNLFVLDGIRLRIEGLVVANTYRGNGIGKKLMAFVEEIAKENSPAIIDLTSGLRRAKDGTHEFYKSLGYQDEGSSGKLYFRKSF